MSDEMCTQLKSNGKVKASARMHREKGRRRGTYEVCYKAAISNHIETQKKWVIVYIAKFKVNLISDITSFFE